MLYHVNPFHSIIWSGSLEVLPVILIFGIRFGMLFCFFVCYCKIVMFEHLCVSLLRLKDSKTRRPSQSQSSRHALIQFNLIQTTLNSVIDQSSQWHHHQITSVPLTHSDTSHTILLCHSCDLFLEEQVIPLIPLPNNHNLPYLIIPTRALAKSLLRRITSSPFLFPLTCPTEMWTFSDICVSALEVFASFDVCGFAGTVQVLSYDEFSHFGGCAWVSRLLWDVW